MKVRIVSATKLTVRGVLKTPWYESRIGEEFWVSEISKDLAERTYRIPDDGTEWYKSDEGLINKADTVPC